MLTNDEISLLTNIYVALHDIKDHGWIEKVYIVKKNDIVCEKIYLNNIQYVLPDVYDRKLYDIEVGDFYDNLLEKFNEFQETSNIIKIDMQKHGKQIFIKLIA